MRRLSQRLFERTREIRRASPCDRTKIPDADIAMQIRFINARTRTICQFAKAPGFVPFAGSGNRPRIGSATVTMETVVIGYQPQPDKLCELLLLTITNGILQQLTSVSHGFCANSFGRQRIAAEPKL